MILPGIFASQISGHLSAAGNLVSLQTVTVGSGGASSITFSSIPQTYTHLQIRGISRGAGTGAAAGWGVAQFNGDTTYTNYNNHAIFGTGSSAGATNQQNSTYPGVVSSATPGNTATANAFAPSIMDILDYTNTNKNKTVRQLTGYDGNDTNGEIDFTSGVWLNTSAITSITLLSIGGRNLVQYSQYALYGVK